jgi:hypothetical protein
MVIDRLSTLREEMANDNSTGREVIEQMTSRLTEARSYMQQELKQIADASQQTVSSIEQAALSATQQAGTMRSELQTSENSLRQLASVLREESRHLPATIEQGKEQINSASQTLKQQTEIIAKALETTAVKFSDVIGTIRSQMGDESTRLTALIEGADQALRRFGRQLAEQITAMHQGVGTVSAEGQQMVEKANATVVQLGSASERLARVRGEAQDMAEKLIQEFGSLESRIGVTRGKLDEAGTVATSKMGELLNASQKVEAQMQAASASFREQLERMRSSVQLQIDDINRGLMQATAQLERTGTALRTSTQATAADIDKVASRFDQTALAANQQLNDRAAKLRSVTEESAGLLSSFGDQFDTLLDRLAMAGDGIKRHEGSLNSELQGMMSQLTSLTERLDASRVMTGTVAEQAIARMADVAQTVERQLVSLADNSQTAIGVVRGTGSAYQEQAKSFADSIQQTKQQLDDLQLRSDRMRVALKMQGEDLINSLAQIMAQLESVGESTQMTIDKGLKKIG